MDMRKTAREIGLFETAINVAKVAECADVVRKVGAVMPLPSADIGEEVNQIAKWLLAFDKSKYMFLTPEIALVDALAKLDKNSIEVIMAIPCDMDTSAKDRLKNNLPRSIVVTVLEEPYFPEAFFPENGILVVCGYTGGGRIMALPDTYRMVEHYKGFLGKKVFVPYVELENAARYDGWLEISQQRFSTSWRDVYEKCSSN